jgi:hypothetical protein
MQRSCQQCGRAYPAQRPTSKYCSSSCRGQAAKDRKAGKSASPRSKPAAQANQAQQPATAPPGGAGDVVEAVQRELEAVGRADSALGRAALALAARVSGVSGQMETGSAYAALIRELRTTIEAAKQGASGAGDPIDELRERRERRRRAASS